MNQRRDFDFDYALQSQNKCSMLVQGLPSLPNSRRRLANIMRPTESPITAIHRFASSEASSAASRLSTLQLLLLPFHRQVFSNDSPQFAASLSRELHLQVWPNIGTRQNCDTCHSVLSLRFFQEHPMKIAVP